MSIRAKQRILDTHPHIARFVGEIGTVRLISRVNYSIPEAVCRTVISQMLSASAAATIRARAMHLAEANGFDGIADLCYDDLRESGLSNAKARTITEFASAYRENPSRYEAWRRLPSDALFAEVNQFWGLSDWSASILGIFYFGNPDVFPVGDGSIARAVALLEECVKVPKRKSIIDTELCRPFRSYLALYLWRMLDDGILLREVNRIKGRRANRQKV